MVDLAAAVPCDVGYHAVEYDAVGLVLVETQVEELAQVPAALGGPEGVGAARLPGAGVALRGARVLQEEARSRVARNPSPITGAPVVV